MLTLADFRVRNRWPLLILTLWFLLWERSPLRGSHILSSVNCSERSDSYDETESVNSTNRPFAFYVRVFSKICQLTLKVEAWTNLDVIHISCTSWSWNETWVNWRSHKRFLFRLEISDLSNPLLRGSTFLNRFRREDVLIENARSSFNAIIGMIKDEH